MFQLFLKNTVNKIFPHLLLMSLLFIAPPLFSLESDNLNSGQMCQRQLNFPPIQLNFSQKGQGKNEFYVGWSYGVDHDNESWQRPQVGAEIVIVRCLPPGRYVEIARGQVERLNAQMLEATVYSSQYDEIVQGQQTQELVETRNLIWRPMVGDEVFPVYKEVRPVTVVSPKIRLNANALFLKEEDGHISLTLSQEGQDLLREKFAEFKNKSGRLLVEGFILTTGNRESLRTESLMRAQTVSTFLIREFALQPNQVVPIGYGNDWLETGMQTIEKNDLDNFESGIILKILSD